MSVIGRFAGEAQPVQRGARENIVFTVALLASDDGGFITGTHILVDGGMTIGTRARRDPSEPSLFAALEALRA